MRRLPITLLGVLIILFLFYISCTFVVNEGQKSLLLRLGKLERTSTDQVEVFNPGIHFKIPFLESAQIFDTRLQTLDISSSRIVTAEKKDVIVDYYVKWQISNLPQYFISTGGNQQIAETLLQQQVNDSLRAQFGRTSINGVVTDDRSKIMDAILKQANKGAEAFGVLVNDVRIKRIDLPAEVSNTVFSRMRAERERAATEFRSKGQANAMAIRANADATVTLTVAKAQAQAAAIRAKGLAAAAKIYADAFNQDPSFYAFYRSMVVYQNVFNQKKDVLVLRPNSDFLKYFNSADANSKDGKASS